MRPVPALEPKKCLFPIALPKLTALHCKARPTLCGSHWLVRLKGPQLASKGRAATSQSFVSFAVLDDCNVADELWRFSRALSAEILSVMGGL
jgi:hypothetical protein